MRKLPFVSFILVCLLLSVLSFQSCVKDNITRTYTILRPVMADRSEVIAQIKPAAPKTLSNPGKIYLYGSYLFINEIDKGVHIIDNSRPENPRPQGFIAIPGNVDIAVKGNVLYADMYTDLLSIDITDPTQAKLETIVEDVFPERRYGNGFVAGQNQIIVDWIRKDTTVDGNVINNGNWCNCLIAFSDAFESSKAAAMVPGIAGSMARFTIVQNILYAVNNNSLNVVDISIPLQPQVKSNTMVGWDIETIYPFRDKLFIGSATGMFIYSIESPFAPVRLGAFSHARACDPVVANDEHAFVTLRTGTACMGTANQLDVLDIRNIHAPALIKSYPLKNPHGLAVDGDALFVCDGDDGLKLYDISNIESLKLTRHLKGMNAYDVIAWNSRLILMAKEGLFQFDYSNPQDLRLISTLPVKRS